MFPIQTIMAPLADKGLCLHAYPHPDRDDGTWVLQGSTLQGDTCLRQEVPGTHLDTAFPPEGGKFIVERYTTNEPHTWTLKLLHGETEVVVREFPPETGLLTALKDFFNMPLMWALLPHLKRLIDDLGRM